MHQSELERLVVSAGSAEELEVLGRWSVYDKVRYDQEKCKRQDLCPGRQCPHDEAPSRSGDSARHLCSTLLRPYYTHVNPYQRCIHPRQQHP